MQPSATHPTYPAPRQPPEDLTFRPSPDTTLGVELELQVLDPRSGELAPGAPAILDACAAEGVDGVVGEFLLGMIEVKTGVCRNVAEVRDTLFASLRRARAVAGALGYDLAVGGTHPFSRRCVVSPDERYQRIRERQGWLAEQEATFGLHVHVGVPGGDEVVGLVNLLVPYLPHLLALSANSPFWQGADTGFSSARSAVFRPSPHAGVGQPCARWDDFCNYYQVLRAGGALEAMKDVYWDLRPRPDLGTIEFRVCDAPPTLSCVLGLTALMRCLVLEGLRLLRERGPLPADPAPFWLAAENKWRAARYGLRAECVRRPGDAPRTLADDTDELIEWLLPAARQAGEADFLKVFRPLAGFEPGADRQRRLLRRTGDWRAVLDDLRGRWARELGPGADPLHRPAFPAWEWENLPTYRDAHASPGA